MKRPDNWTRWTAAILGSAAALSLALAEDAPKPANSLSSGQVTKGFTLPQYENGQMNAMITGDEARTISVNRTEVTNLKVQLYENGTVSTTITSPKSDYWQADNKMRTRFGVTITRSDLIITAQTMDWELKGQRGVLRQNVKVVVTNFDLNQPASKPDPRASAPLSSTPSETPAATDSPGLQLQPAAPSENPLLPSPNP